MQENNPMQFGLFFLLGAVVGAVFALLFAPSSGDELRKSIKAQAESQYAKLQDEVQKGMQKMQSSVEKLGDEIQTAVRETKQETLSE